MEKLKNVLSRKSVDNTREGQASPIDQTHTATGGLSGEGSHLAGANQSLESKGASTTGNASEEYHPIFDQFTGHSASDEPTKSTEQPPHPANTTTSNQPAPSAIGGPPYSEKSESTPTSEFRPDAMHRSTLNTEGMSTASIKSGVLGFPQDGESHAALSNLPGERGLDATQTETSSQLPDRTLDHEKNTPGMSKESAVGAATTGTATGLAARELSGRHEEEKPVQQSHALSSDRTADKVSEPASQQRKEGPNVIGDTDRTFPLAGGVTSRKEAEPTPTAAQSSSEPSSTHPEPLGLASTTAPTSSKLTSTNPSSTGVTSATSEREPGTKDRDVGLGDGREALAGAAAAGVATTAASSAGKSEHDHGGHGHTYDGPRYIDEKEKPNTGLVFTEGPHVTDTANLVDPHLHIPGEFPDPTPIEEPSQPSFGAGGATAGLGPTSRQPDTASSIPSEKPTQEHHYGRDAALAGGAGAAGLGAYEAGKHHQREATDIGNEPAIESSTSPYSSQKLDPRVDSKPRGLEEKRVDPITQSSSTPQAKDQHYGRDAAVVGGTAGAAGLGGYEASKHRPQEQENVQPSSTLPQTNQGISQTQIPSSQQQKTTEGLSQTTEPGKEEHHYGRDAAAVGGLGAAGAGAYAYSQRNDEKDSGPASSTIGPHKSNAANVVDPRVQPDPALQKHHEAGPTPEDPASATVGPHKSNVANVLDPRVQPEPEKQKGHTTTGPHQSDTLNRVDPKAEQTTQPESQHHYGRDAAVAGGTGAAGYGAYEAAEKYDEHRSTQPGAHLEEQRYDPTAQGAHDPNQTGQHHYGRDAAIAGGLGAAGAGAYAHSQREQTDQPLSNQAYQQSSTTQQTTQPTQGYQPSATQQFSSTQPTAGSHQRFDSAQEPREQQHQKRDAAAVAGVGAAGAGAGYEYSKHEAEKAQKEQLAQQQKDFEKQQKEQEHAAKHQQKELDKQQAKDQKEHDKFIAAEEKKHHKEVEKKEAAQQKEMDKQKAKDQKEHDKFVAAEEKKHHKEVEKKEAAQQKEMDKEKAEEGKEKKHHLFGFLHRDKKDKTTGEPESPTRTSKESPRTSKEYVGLGTAGAAGVGTTAAAYEAGHDSDGNGTKERNRLHKDPPKGHPAREALEHQHEHGGPGIHQHVGIDGPINRPGEISGDYETQHGVYGAHPIDDQKHNVTEPHTGLPMNVEKYGDGHGGTDASPTIRGYHQAPSAENQTGAGQQYGVTD